MTYSVFSILIDSGPGLGKYVSMLYFLMVLTFASVGARAQGANLPALLRAVYTSDQSHQKECLESLSMLPKGLNKAQVDKVCEHMEVMDGCSSSQGWPIFHYNKKGSSNRGQKILAMSLIHGDEGPSGLVATNWIRRLTGIDPRNSWRVIPVANPDGLKAKTRTNANGVDLNRNFPTSDWDDLAIERWVTKKKRDPRRYPGVGAASEHETKCLIRHIKDFKPDFIISIHTPLGVLDFDGPKMKFPSFSPLPWISLGNMPGSLGRYMWKDHDVPVLTIELKGNRGVTRLEQFDRLQDVSGTVAIQSDRILKNKNKR